MIERTELVELLVQSGCELESTDVDFQQSYSELGLDSLEVFDFFRQIDEKLGVDVPDKDLDRLKNLEDTYQYLINKLK